MQYIHQSWHSTLNGRYPFPSLTKTNERLSIKRTYLSKKELALGRDCSKRVKPAFSESRLVLHQNKQQNYQSGDAPRRASLGGLVICSAPPVPRRCGKEAHRVFSGCQQPPDQDEQDQRCGQQNPAHLLFGTLHKILEAEIP